MLPAHHSEGIKPPDTLLWISGCQKCEILSTCCSSKFISDILYISPRWLLSYSQITPIRIIQPIKQRSKEQAKKSHVIPPLLRKLSMTARRLLLQPGNPAREHRPTAVAPQCASLIGWLGAEWRLSFSDWSSHHPRHVSRRFVFSKNEKRKGWTKNRNRSSEQVRVVLSVRRLSFFWID